MSDIKRFCEHKLLQTDVLGNFHQSPKINLKISRIFKENVLLLLKLKNFNLCISFLVGFEYFQREIQIKQRYTNSP